MRLRPAVFLDRDGVLNELVIDPLSGFPESPMSVQDVRLVEGAAAAAVRLSAAGFVLVCVSNQPAAAKGRVSVERLISVHRRVLNLLADGGVSIATSRLCMHHPDGTVAELAGPCQCRKPAPGMLVEASEVLGLDLESSWMVGDTDGDIGAGRAAGCHTLLIEHSGSVHKRSSGLAPDLRAPDLATGVTKLLLALSETIR